MLKSGQLFHQLQVVETGIQDKQTITAPVSLILQAASDMSQILSYIKNLRRKHWHHASSNKNQRYPFPCQESKSIIKPV